MRIVRTLISLVFGGCLQHHIEFLAVFVELVACSFLSVLVFLSELAAERWIFPPKASRGKYMFIQADYACSEACAGTCTFMYTA